MKSTLLITAFLAMIFLNSCDNSTNPEDNETKISNFSNDDSHNTGNNCMSCHKNGGSGEGWFQVAGTVYESTGKSTVTGSTIKLYTQPNSGGTLVKTIQVDKKGNFYSTESVDFSSGLYPVVISSNQSITKMSQKITSGACNSCHDGISYNRLW